MTTLEQELRQERRHINDLRVRAERRLDECRTATEALQAQGTEAAEAGDVKGAASIERRIQKLGTLTRRYENLVKEFVDGGNRLAAEVLLARLEGPDLDLLTSDVDRNREIMVQRATALLRTRNKHRALRQRWAELNDKIRNLRQARDLPPPRSFSRVDFKINVNPSTYVQKPDGPTYRDVSDLLRQLGL